MLASLQMRLRQGASVTADYIFHFWKDTSKEDFSVCRYLYNNTLAAGDSSQGLARTGSAAVEARLPPSDTLWSDQLFRNLTLRDYFFFFFWGAPLTVPRHTSTNNRIQCFCTPVRPLLAKIIRTHSGRTPPMGRWMVQQLRFLRNWLVKAIAFPAWTAVIQGSVHS